MERKSLRLQRSQLPGLNAAGAALRPRPLHLPPGRKGKMDGLANRALEENEGDGLGGSGAGPEAPAGGAAQTPLCLGLAA